MITLEICNTDIYRGLACYRKDDDSHTGCICSVFLHCVLKYDLKKWRHTVVFVFVKTVFSESLFPNVQTRVCGQLKYVAFSLTDSKSSEPLLILEHIWKAILDVWELPRSGHRDLWLLRHLKSDKETWPGKKIQWQRQIQKQRQWQGQIHLENTCKEQS